MYQVNWRSIPRHSKDIDSLQECRTSFLGANHDDAVEPRACIRFPQPTPDGSPRQLALLGVFFADFPCAFLGVPDGQVFHKSSRVRMIDLCSVLELHAPTYVSRPHSILTEMHWPGCLYLCTVFYRNAIRVISGDRLPRSTRGLLRVGAAVLPGRGREASRDRQT